MGVEPTFGDPPTNPPVQKKAKKGIQPSVHLLLVEDVMRWYDLAMTKFG